MAFHERGIYCIDKSVEVHIFAEVRASYGFARLRFGLTHVNRVTESIRICVAGEHAHRYGNVARVSAIANPGQGNREVSRVWNTGAIHGNNAAVDAFGRWFSTTRHARNARDRTWEGHDDLVASTRTATAVFNSFGAGQREIDIEVTGIAMRLARNCADGRNAVGGAEIVSANQIGRGRKTVVSLRLYERVINKRSRAMLDRVIGKSSRIDAAKPALDYRRPTSECRP